MEIDIIPDNGKFFKNTQKMETSLKIPEKKIDKFPEN